MPAYSAPIRQARHRRGDWPLSLFVPLLESRVRLLFSHLAGWPVSRQPIG